MNERPLLLTPEQAQQCHVGAKTQMRRILRPQPLVNEHGYYVWTPASEGHNGHYTPDSLAYECPHGVVGDRLWIRTPSIVMTRWACRTVLEITDVRVERLQAITQLDAMHEGCDGPDYTANYFRLWESIHGKGSWVLNPYVWVLSFRRVRA